MKSCKADYDKCTMPKWDVDCDWDDDDMDCDYEPMMKSGCSPKSKYKMDCNYEMMKSDCSPRPKCKMECVKTYKCYYKLYRCSCYRLFKCCPRCGHEFDYHRHRGTCPRCQRNM